MDTAVQKFRVSESLFIKKCFKETTFIQGFIKLISKKVGENLQGQQDSFTALIYAGRERERGKSRGESIKTSTGVRLLQESGQLDTHTEVMDVSEENSP